MHPPIPPERSGTAGFWPRAVAWCVDVILLCIPTLLLAAALPAVRDAGLRQHWRALGEAMGRQMDVSIRQGGDFFSYLRDVHAADGLVRPALENFHHALLQGAGIPLLLFLLLGLGYWPLLESGRAQATFGKRLVGLQVCDGRFASLRLARALKRHLAGSLSWLSLNIGHLLMATNPRNRALHDHIADTCVVWRQGAARRTPWWGWLLMAAMMAAPLLIAALAARELNAAMKAVFPA